MNAKPFGDSGDPSVAGGRKLGRELFGYRRRPVDELLRQIAQAIASAEGGRDGLAARIAGLEADLARRRELERLLDTTLISTERAADAVRQRVCTEADQVLDDARAKARRLLVDAVAERERLDVHNGERAARLHTALAILETEQAASGPAALDEALLEEARRAADDEEPAGTSSTG